MHALFLKDHEAADGSTEESPGRALARSLLYLDGDTTHNLAEFTRSDIEVFAVTASVMVLEPNTSVD